MSKEIFCSLLFVIAFSAAGRAQQYLFGRIFKKGSQEILPGVSVHNCSTRKYNTSDQGGNYRIAATGGDTIVFSSAGYLADTFFLSSTAPVQAYNIVLTPNVVALPTVQIDELSKYEADSVQRRKDYAFPPDRKHPVKLMNEKR